MIKTPKTKLKKVIKMVPKTYLTHDMWISLSNEQRAYIKLILGIKSDTNPQVIDNKIISDGVSQGVLNEFFSPSKVRDYIGSKSKEWHILWAEFINEVDSGIIEKKERHELDELRKRRHDGRIDTIARQERLDELEKKYVENKDIKEKKDDK